MTGWWDRHVVPRAIGFCCTQPPIMERRAEVVPLATGHVLELGAGGGANLGFYDRRAIKSVTGVDPSDELIDLARKRATDADAGFFRVEHGTAEALPFADASFDTVVSTFTLCSVADQAQALREARRVLKPGGRLLFLEHGLSPDAGTRKWQHRLDPLWCRLVGGCHLARPVTAAIESAGFTVADRHGRYMERTPRFVGWVEWGAGSTG